MAYRGAVEDFRTVRNQGVPRRVPCVAQSEEFDVKWHGRYCYEELCQSGDKIYEVWSAAIREFDYDWAWVQIDDCFEFEPIGIACPGDGDILRATSGVLKVGEGLDRIRTMDPLRDGRMPEKLKAIRRLREEFGDDVLVTGSIAAPFSAVGLAWGIEESMLLIYDDPRLLREAMERWKDFYMRYLKAQQQAGAHAIWFGDCNAFSGLLSVEQYQEHIFAVTRELVQYAEQELNLMMWMHNSEIKVPHVLSHVPLGLSFESIGPAADIAAVRKATRGKEAISGNLDPIEVLWRGNPETIAAEVRRIMAVGKPGGGYIFAPGEMNPRDIPAVNMHAMMDTAHSLARY